MPGKQHPSHRDDVLSQLQWLQLPSAPSDAIKYTAGGVIISAGIVTQLHISHQPNFLS